MKKFLNLVGQAFLISSLGLTAVACTNPLANGDGSKPKPPDPIVKDKEYYEKLIAAAESDISDCDEMLAEIKVNRDGYDDEADYQSALDEVTAEQFHLSAQITEYQLAILFLEVPDLNFTPEQVLQGMVQAGVFITNLDSELKLKEKYPDYYTKEELAEIRDNIEFATALFQYFSSLKED